MILSKKSFNVNGISILACFILVIFLSNSVFKGYDNFIGYFTIFLEKYKIKFLLIFIVCFIYLIDIIFKRKTFFPNKLFKKEFLLFCLGIFTLIVITFIKQFYNGFRVFSWIEVLHLITPLLFVVLYISSDDKSLDDLINLYFYICLIMFLFKNLTVLNINSLKQISFVNSFSPFESGFSNLMIYFEIFYLSQRKNKFALLSYFIVFLSLKRISVIVGFFLLLFIPKMVKANHFFVSKKIIYFGISLFVIMPFIMIKFYDLSTYIFFQSKLGIDLNELTLSRYKFTTLVLSHRNQLIYGLGSVTDFLSKNIIDYNGQEVINLHCDILKLFLECGFFGLFIFVLSFFKSCFNNMFSFLIIFITFLDLIFNHALFGGGLTHLWIIIYLLIIYFNYYYLKDGVKNVN